MISCNEDLVREHRAFLSQANRFFADVVRTPVDAKRILQLEPAGMGATPHLPSGSPSPSELAAALVDSLDLKGAFSEPFFEKLRKVYAGRGLEIDELSALWGSFELKRRAKHRDVKIQYHIRRLALAEDDAEAFSERLHQAIDEAMAWSKDGDRRRSWNLLLKLVPKVLQIGTTQDQLLVLRKLLKRHYDPELRHLKDCVPFVALLALSLADEDFGHENRESRAKILNFLGEYYKERGLDAIPALELLTTIPERKPMWQLDLEKAKLDFAEASQLVPDDPVPRYNLALVCAGLGAAFRAMGMKDSDTLMVTAQEEMREVLRLMGEQPRYRKYVDPMLGEATRRLEDLPGCSWWSRLKAPLKHLAPLLCMALLGLFCPAAHAGANSADVPENKLVHDDDDSVWEQPPSSDGRVPSEGLETPL
ncbi:MAG: hypothetical protein H6739_39350 [Alphaproteobacteria bacterium]|nr:hypothetical protein [Alphaproteobacteria bacterium]